MKTVDISKATESLARYTRSIRRGPVVVTRKGRPVAALLPIENADAETTMLSTNPRFLALIERARVRHDKEGGQDLAQVRRRFGLRSPTRRVRRKP
jgi:prevent-host-death family protein